MNYAAIVPLKKASERVPRKNWRTLGGRPLYTHILESLIGVKAIDPIIIDTDSEREFPEAAHPRVIIRRRPDHLRGHHVSMNRIIGAILADHPAPAYLQTHATNPFISSETIARALDEYERDTTSLFSVTRHQARFYWDTGSPINHDPDDLVPTQELESLYEENSCLYCFTRRSFECWNSRIGPQARMFETPLSESLDIDTEDDWKLAEAFLG